MSTAIELSRLSTKILAMANEVRNLEFTDTEIIIGLQLLTLFMSVGYFLSRFCQNGQIDVQGRNVFVRMSLAISCLFLWPGILLCAGLVELWSRLKNRNKKKNGGVISFWKIYLVRSCDKGLSFQEETEP